MSKQAGRPGPGAVRVGRFIGKLGVVSIPAVGVGLDLDERVVRRHVAKLETSGWLIREPWVWGEGSIVWLTSAGIEGTGLAGLRPVKSPPGATTISHGVRVGWSAARLERRGRAWKTARELAVDRDLWAVPTLSERGFTEQLPDLVAWPNPAAGPVAVIVESGHRREDRQKLILEGWRDAILSGRYAAVRYDCTSPSVAHWINRLAEKVGLTDRAFAAVLQPSAAEIAALSPTAEKSDEAAEPEQVTTPEFAHPDDVPKLVVSSAALGPPSRPMERVPRWQPEAEAPEAAAERQRLCSEIFGIEGSRPRRTWRR